MLKLPQELHQILPFLQRSEEFKQIEPIVSYYCKYYALKKALSLVKLSQSSECKSFINELLNELEAERKEIEFPESEQQSIQIIQVTGMKIFKQANEEDELEIYSENNVKRFVAAGNILETLKSFGELDESISKIVKYSKVRATALFKELDKKKSISENKEMEKNEVFSFSEDSSSNLPNRNNESNHPIESFHSLSLTMPKERSEEKHVTFMHQNSIPSENHKQPIISLTAQQITLDAQKYARYAISALQFDDIETAKKNLKEALSLLEGYSE